MLASALLEQGLDSGWTWLALALNVCIWPHLAFLMGRRAADPVARENLCLMVDSALGGAWIALLGLSPAPTAVLVTLLTADKIAAGGWMLLRRCTLTLLGGFVFCWLLLGMPWAPALSLRTFLLSLPFMFIYTVALSYLTYRQASRISRQNRELERLTRTDPVSGLANRRHFEAQAGVALERFRDTGVPAAMMLIDLDFFKEINDRHGHGVGDQVLLRVGEVLQTMVREDDVPARYGGDEFSVLLYDSELEGACLVAERICTAVGALRLADEFGVNCSVSVGVAQLGSKHATVSAWVEAADVALYRAKASGRNRVHPPSPAL